MTNVPITHSPLHHVRCDAAVATHPTNVSKLVAAGKHVPNFAQGKCHVQVHYSADAGASWSTASDLALPTGAYGTLSPSLTWDNAGNVFLALASCSSTSSGRGTGIYVYKSADGGATWSAPVTVAVGTDFPALAADPVTGAVYLVGREPMDIRCATSTDGGATWVLTMSGGMAARLNSGGYEVSAPAITVGEGATSGSSLALIVWYSDGSVYGVHSTDGAVTFVSTGNLAITAPGATVPNPIPITHDPGFPALGDDANYLPAPSCTAQGGTFAVAWTIFPLQQIGFKVVEGSDVTQLPMAPLQLIERPGQACFEPQLAAAPDGTIGCAFYQVEPSRSGPRIDVSFTVLPDALSVINVTDNAWRPEVGAYVVGGHADVSFVVEPFGLAADASGRWHAVWPDTRTGRRELWTMAFLTPPTPLPLPYDLKYFAEVVTILFGVIQDGGGFTIPGGHVPPWGPPDGLAIATLGYQLAQKLPGARGAALRQLALKFLAVGANRELSAEGASSAELAKGASAKTEG